MKLRFNLFVAASLLMFSGLFMGKAHAIDIPVLTWEQGKSQSVVLGDPTGGTSWDVKLKSSSGNIGEFRVSRSNSADFKVYTINIPNNLPVGSYTIQTSALNYPSTIVAKVLLIAQTVYEIPRAPIDLLLILCLLSIIVSTPSLIRSYSLRFVRTENQLSDIENLIDGKYWYLKEGVTFNSFEIKRVESYKLFRPSVFKQILLIDGSHIYKYKFHAFVILPILSICLSAVLFVIQNRINEFMNPLTLIFITILIAISVLDLYSGLVAGLLYVTLTVVFYSQFGVRGLAQAILMAIIFVLPAAINLLGVALFSKVNKEFEKSWLYSLIGASSFGLAIMTAISLESGSFVLLPFIASISIGFYLLARIKVQLFSKFIEPITPIDKTGTIDQQLVARVISPLSISSFFVIIIIVFFNWSESLAIAIFATIFWTLPLLISILRLENRFLKYLKNLPRNLYIELLLVTSSVIGIFYLSEGLPLLIQDRALLLISLLALPAIFHASYVAVAESGRQIDEIAS